jgi:hypothetical protein
MQLSEIHGDIMIEVLSNSEAVKQALHQLERMLQE